ncbi:MAG: DUF374 domain-containing protein [Gemmatimonadota bacterium]|nr:DUF374 domain-containing protein [Gemmatimonadota bacterium]
MSGTDAVLAAGLRALGRSWRYFDVAEDGRVSPARFHTGGALHVFWHRDALALLLRHREEGVGVMVSRSADGDVAAAVAARLGYRPFRGSSSRDGQAAMRGMIEAGAKGIPLGLAVDGPRGPARICKGGAVRIAAASGIPVVPLAAAARRAVTLRSWDRFQVPLPGARVYVAQGRPLPVPAGPDLDFEAWQSRIAAALDAGAVRARRAAEREGGRA